MISQIVASFILVIGFAGLVRYRDGLRFFLAVFETCLGLAVWIRAVVFPATVHAQSSLLPLLVVWVGTVFSLGGMAIFSKIFGLKQSTRLSEIEKLRG